MQPAAAGGLIDRRMFLRRGGAISAALTAYGAAPGAVAAPLEDDPSSRILGRTPIAYEQRARFEEKIGRSLTNPNGEPRNFAARTPHHLVEGTITPNGLHFVISWGGIPDIDPDRHRLAIHGLVRKPLVFTLDALAGYPMVTRTTFLECGGNSAPLFSPQPVQAGVQAIHGLASCAEWTGVPLAILLDEAGVDPRARWVIAEGADAAGVSRSVPLGKAMDDAMIALYQNGERLMPANGYPLRLLLPGWEGNMNIKYLRRLKLTEEPAMSYWETRVYTPILPGGKAYQFYFIQEVKSFITRPSPGLTMRGKGLYEISGVAYSGNGRISRVMVSADGGRTWAEAALTQPVASKAFTRFRLPWRWDGSPAVLQSRAWDEAGYAQPTRAEFVAQRGELKKSVPAAAFPGQHHNAVCSWTVESSGEVRHVYA